MKMNKKFIINVHNNACEQIVQLEETIADTVIEQGNQKDKANFGNLCIALKGFRMVSEATEALLRNEGCFKGEDGFFYDRVNLEENDNKQDRTPDKGEGKAE